MSIICKIFYGPSREFNKIIEEESYSRNNTLSLRDLVKIMDSAASLSNWLEERRNEEPSILIGSGEAFSSIREHFIDNLPDILESLIMDGYINKCLFQNPPLSFKRKITQMLGEELQEVMYEYKKINKDSLIKIYQEYKDDIIGQEKALVEILSTLYPMTNKSERKPVVMMFYGPPGVGKTESAKIINKSLMQGELFRQQLSMFQTTEFASYLFGGSIETPSLAKDLIKRESNVILFDEFNRCPPHFFSAFYQMFDEGIYIDKNYEVNLENTIIICTANYESKQEILSAIGGPLFSRFDHFISFSPLSSDAKKTLITNKYNEVLELWDIKENEILKGDENLEMLLKHADTFTNARNIDKGVKGSLARKLVLDMLKEHDGNRK